MTETLGEWERRTGYERLADEIAGLPEADEPHGEVVLVPEPENAPCVLLERDYAGLRVEIAWHPALGVTLYVKLGEEIGRVVIVPDDKALDAFHHPYVYLPA